MHPRSRITFAAAAAAISIACGHAQADLINIQSNGAGSTEGLGTFSGSLNYQPAGANAATIVVSLTNTSPLGNGGYITALAIWHTTNSGLNTVSFTSSNDGNFGGLAGPVSGAPFGSYKAGASTGGGWLGGGNPGGGLAVGESATFTFSLSGTGVGLLSASTFVGTNNGNFDLVVRFRGFEDGGSDKVPGMIVPTPAAAALLGLSGLMAGRRRR